MFSLALVTDLMLREPPQAMHPVVWMGKVVSFLTARSVGHRPLLQFLCGAGIVLLTLAIFVAPAYFVLFYLEGLNTYAYLAVGALMLKPTFSLKELYRAASKVKNLLVSDMLDEGRFELRSLVSRNTQDLPSPMLVSATVESVAENTCDSFVAPLFYFLLFGVPGAIAYRVVNTMDAMIGYHGEYEYLGKFAAKLDDVLNYIPARFTALLFVLAALLSRRNARNSCRTVRYYHSQTESPNAGWPMSAMAGALNVQFRKDGHYKIGTASAPLAPATIGISLRLMLIAAFTWAALCFTVGLVQLVYFT